MLKVYKLIYYTVASIYFFVDGKEVFTKFKGTQNEKGSFATRDQKLQDAIEADPRFGKEFILAYDEGAKVETINSTSESAVEAKETTVDIKEVTAKNLQGINDLVKELFPSYGKTFKSSEKAVAFFADNGYKLVIE